MTWYLYDPQSTPCVCGHGDERHVASSRGVPLHCRAEECDCIRFLDASEVVEEVEEDEDEEGGKP